MSKYIGCCVYVYNSQCLGDNEVKMANRSNYGADFHSVLKLRYHLVLVTYQRKKSLLSPC